MTIIVLKHLGDLVNLANQMSQGLLLDANDCLFRNSTMTGGLGEL